MFHSFYKPIYTYIHTTLVETHKASQNQQFIALGEYLPFGLPLNKGVRDICYYILY